MKTLITGVAGTGKSTIAKTLRQKNIFAVDFSDVKDMCFWQDVKTGEKVEYSPVHSHEWFLTVKRICDINVLKQILAKREDVVIAGVASGNINEYLPLFDKVILLQCGAQENIHRLLTRNNPSGYGKTEIEQKDNIEWQKNFDPQLLSYGAIPVNTEGDFVAVVDKIIALINN